LAVPCRGIRRRVQRIRIRRKKAVIRRKDSTRFSSA